MVPPSWFRTVAPGMASGPSTAVSTLPPTAPALSSPALLPNATCRNDSPFLTASVAFAPTVTSPPPPPVGSDGGGGGGFDACEGFTFAPPPPPQPDKPSANATANAIARG